MSFERPGYEDRSEGQELVARAQSIGEISYLGTNNSNNFDFKDVGALKKSEETQLSSSALQGLNSEEIEYLNKGLEIFHYFLTTPIFTDSFHANHYARRIWEDNHLNELSDSAKKYYHSNRLGSNRCASVINFLETIKDTIRNQNIQDKLKNIYSNVPAELVRQKKNPNNPNDETKKDYIDYPLLSDEQKIEVVKRLSDLVSEAVILIQEKK